MKKFTITVLLLLFSFTLLPAEAKVKLQYSNVHVPVVAKDHCSRMARKIGCHYIEFCNYDFKPLDNETSFYYILLLDNTYFVTTNSKAYALVVAAVKMNTHTTFFQKTVKDYIITGGFGKWGVLGYLENNPIFGWTFLPNKDMLTLCWKNKKNRYFFERG